MSLFKAFINSTVVYTSIVISLALGFSALNSAKAQTVPTTAPATAAPAATYSYPIPQQYSGPATFNSECFDTNHQPKNDPLCYGLNPALQQCTDAYKDFLTKQGALPKNADQLKSLGDCQGYDGTAYDALLSDDKLTKDDCDDEFGQDSDSGACKALNAGTSADFKDDKKTAESDIKDLKSSITDLQTQMTDAKNEFTKKQADIQNQEKDAQKSLQQAVDDAPLKLKKALAGVDADTQKAVQDGQAAAMKVQEDVIKLQDTINRDAVDVSAAQDNQIVACRGEATAKLEALKAQLDARAAEDAKLVFNYSSSSLAASKKDSQRKRIKIVNEAYDEFYADCMGATSPGAPPQQKRSTMQNASLQQIKRQSRNNKHF